MASEKFIERINAREIEAFKEIYDRYYRTLVVYAANFIEDGDVGEDLVQELIINIWENRMTFTSLSTFNAYLYNAVRNASLNYLKHEGVAEKYMEYLSQTYSPVEEESSTRKKSIVTCLTLSTACHNVAAKYSCYIWRAGKTMRLPICCNFLSRR